MKKLLLMLVLLVSGYASAQTAVTIDDTTYITVGDPTFSRRGVNQGRAAVRANNWSRIERIHFRNITRTSYEMTYYQSGEGRLIEFWLDDVNAVQFGEGSFQTVSSNNGVFPFLEIFN